VGLSFGSVLSRPYRRLALVQAHVRRAELWLHPGCSVRRAGLGLQQQNGRAAAPFHVRHCTASVGDTILSCQIVVAIRHSQRGSGRATFWNAVVRPAAEGAARRRRLRSSSQGKRKGAILFVISAVRRPAPQLDLVELLHKVYVNPLVQILQRVSEEDIASLRLGAQHAAQYYRYYLMNVSMRSIPTAVHAYPDGYALDMLAAALQVRKISGTENIRTACVKERRDRKHRYVDRYHCDVDRTDSLIRRR